MTLIGRGYVDHSEDADKSRDDMPTQNIITRLTGPGTVKPP